jgi:hypothetical protein
MIVSPQSTVKHFLPKRIKDESTRRNILSSKSDNWHSPTYDCMSPSPNNSKKEIFPIVKINNMRNNTPQMDRLPKPMRRF